MEINEHYIIGGILVTTIGVLFKLLLNRFKKEAVLTERVVKAFENNTTAIKAFKKQAEDSTKRIMAAQPKRR